MSIQVDSLQDAFIEKCKGDNLNYNDVAEALLQAYVDGTIEVEIKPMHKRDGREMTNEELKQAVENAIQISGYKKLWISEQLGMSKQSLYKLLNKQNFTLDDANKILSVIGYDIRVQVTKKERAAKN